MRIPSDKKQSNTERRLPVAARRGLWVLIPALLSGCAGMSASQDYKPFDDRAAGIDTDLKALADVRRAVPANIGLKEAIDFALTNNLDLQMAQWEIDAASEANASAQLKMLPNLDVNARYAERSEYMNRSLYNTDTGEIVPSTVVSDGKTTETADLTLTWKVLDSMVNYVAAQQASVEVMKKRLAREKLRQKVALEVTEAFWKAAADEDLMEAMRETKRQYQDAVLQLRKALIKNLKSKAARDPAARREVARFEYDMKKQEYDRVKGASDLLEKNQQLTAELRELETWRGDIGKNGQPDDPAFRNDLDNKIHALQSRIDSNNAAMREMGVTNQSAANKLRMEVEDLKEPIKAQLTADLARATAAGRSDEKAALLKELYQLEQGYLCSSLTMPDLKVEEIGVTRLQITDGCKKIADIDVAIQQTQDRLASARLKLVNLMGMTQRGDFELRRRKMKDVVVGLPRPNTFKINALECMALRNQPELYAQDITIRQHQDEGRKAMMKMFPGVNLFAGDYWDGNNLLENNVWNSIGASLSWNLFSIPAQYKEMKSKEKEEVRQRVKRILITSSAITSAHVALLDYNNKTDRFRLLDESEFLAAKAHEYAQQLNAVGRLGTPDSTTEPPPVLLLAERRAESAATIARSSEAMVDALVAYSQLLSTAGVPPELWTEELDRIGLAGADAGQRLVINFPEVRDGGQSMPGQDCGALVDPGSVPVRTTTVAPEERKQRTAAIATAIDTPTTRRSESATSEWANNSLWSVQVGAFEHPKGPAKRLSEIEGIGVRLADPRDAKMSSTTKAGRELKRVRFYGFSREEATRFVDELRSKGMEYWLVPPYSKFN